MLGIFHQVCYTGVGTVVGGVVFGPIGAAVGGAVGKFYHLTIVYFTNLCFSTIL